MSNENNRPQFKLDEFEGPLDLLLHLVRKNKLSIFDISTSDITEQYLQYADSLKHQNLDCSAEFLDVASQLLRIKSAGLLPRPVRESPHTEDAPEDDEAQLIKRLQEYQQVKLCAKLMDNLSAKESMGFFKPPEQIKLRKNVDLCKITQGELLRTYRKLLDRLVFAENQKVAVTQKVRSVVKVSVFTKIKDILRILRKKSIRFYEYFSNMTHREEKISAFLAVLELIKQNRIRLESLYPEDFSEKNIFITKV